jgi:hypothetical protein
MSTLLAKTAHAERSPEGEVEACVGLNAAPFDFPFDSANAPLRVRSGRAEMNVRVREDMCQSPDVCLVRHRRFPFPNPLSYRPVRGWAD